MKKYLIYGGMFLASLLVINVAMYFFLNMTQPRTATTVLDPAHEQEISESGEQEQATEIAGNHSEPEPEAASEPSGDSREVEGVVLDHRVELTESPDTLSTERTKTKEVHKTEPVETPVAQAEHMLADVQQGDEKQLAKLAKLLEGMKPDQAAAIASRLNTGEIVTLVMRMKDRKAAKMLAAMPVDKSTKVARRMSELVATRGHGS